MKAGPYVWGDIARGVGSLALFVAALWLVWRRPSRSRGLVKAVDDEAPGTPYRVFDASADRDVRARDAVALLEAEDHAAGVAPPKGLNWRHRIATAEHATATLEPSFGEPTAKLSACLAERRKTVAVMLLIDHSGSMRDQMVPLSAIVRWFSEVLDREATPLAIGGYTTLGWRGGAPRRRWLAANRPPRPGRLCALLHLRYREFDAALADDDWRVMLHPAVLRENIDGEAIEWALARLRARTEPRRLLVVLSDGAPVDDATLLSNGPQYLERHLRRVIAAAEEAGDVRLAAVGIGHAVDRYYGRSRSTPTVDAVPEALSAVVCDALA